jgi:hypothetical protein
MRLDQLCQSAAVEPGPPFLFAEPGSDEDGWGDVAVVPVLPFAEGADSHERPINIDEDDLAGTEAVDGSGNLPSQNACKIGGPSDSCTEPKKESTITLDRVIL